MAIGNRKDWTEWLIEHGWERSYDGSYVFKLRGESQLEIEGSGMTRLLWAVDRHDDETVMLCELGTIEQLARITEVLNA
jgi:hypothetical protein